MNSWVLNAISESQREAARLEASRRLLRTDLGLSDGAHEECQQLRFVADALEIAVLDALDDATPETALRPLAAEAFQLYRVLPLPEAPMAASEEVLKTACLGVLGDRGTDASKILRDRDLSVLPLDSPSWGDRTRATICNVWSRLIRKSGWEDLDSIQTAVVTLRQLQQQFEEDYLNGRENEARSAAWELIALYHLGKAAELLAVYTTQGEVDGRFDIREQLEGQFDRSITACQRAEIVYLEPLSRLLARTALQLVDNCIWTVTRAVNSRVTQFVRALTSSERPRPIFEMLPPQRRALREAGLLGSGHRAVVVNLPTSSGKTVIAQFRMLQALNQFEQEKGWIAYLAPTRALVNQICARLRKDFAPLSISVERVSPALEIDALEADLLTDSETSTQFRILVTTPEKLDLMLRGGWEQKIQRPLTLVVVDEAHNIAQQERGIKLELLLATINRECRYAQFLLLTPFIDNAGEIARWLSPDSHEDIGLGIDWVPNDRAIVLAIPRQGGRRGDFKVGLETVHTTRNTLDVPEALELQHDRPLGLRWSQVRKEPGKLAAATAQVLKSRGPIILLARTIPDTWSVAEKFKHPDNEREHESEQIALVKRVLAYEFDEDFPLRGLLDYGVSVHHSGLSEEARRLVEWLFETNQIQVLVCTTTIAQGVNFPISGVVLATHQYPGPPPKDIPPEDFWNLAGRTGRVDHGSIGIVALAANDDARSAVLREFISRQVTSLNSTLVDMVRKVMQSGRDLDLHSLSYQPEWSAFLQYLAHTYRQIGNPQRFATEVEQVLRGTLGFQVLRRSNAPWANRLIVGVQEYALQMEGHPGPLKLVDTTGFSFDTVRATLGRISASRLNEDIWDANRLFTQPRRELRSLMGILLQVPELRANLEAATGGHAPDGPKLANMVSDWVQGASLQDMAREYFNLRPGASAEDRARALGECCKNVYGRLIQTASWGLAALQSMTFGTRFEQLPEDEQRALRNLPARVYYGVNSDEAVALRLLGVPREAAQPLSQSLGSVQLPELRRQLINSNEELWSDALGDRGSDYYRVWRVLEGLE